MQGRAPCGAAHRPITIAVTAQTLAAIASLPQQRIRDDARRGNARASRKTCARLARPSRSNALWSCRRITRSAASTASADNPVFSIGCSSTYRSWLLAMGTVPAPFLVRGVTEWRRRNHLSGSAHCVARRYTFLRWAQSEALESR